MIYLLFKLRPDLVKRLGFYAWENVIFRATIALLTAFVLTIWMGPKFIRILKAWKIGDRPDIFRPDLNASLQRKTDTPTMGGVIIVLAIVISTLLWANIKNFYIVMAIFTTIWLAVLGAHDDWLKLTRKDSRSRQWLFGWEKLVFQIALGVIIATFAYAYGQRNPVTHQLTLPFYSGEIYLNVAWFAILTVVVMTGTSNAVNLTDGMDGLSSGCMAIAAFAFMVLALIAGTDMMVNGRTVAYYLRMPYIPTADELAIFCAAILGACVGFLWFNCFPAQVFMGDTGSLPLGGAIGYVAVIIRQEFMLLIIGGVFVMEAVSVMMQVGYFKFTGGKRIFRCAPIHYHFHLGGWTETQTVTRFWLIGAILAALALAIVKLR
ncbi:MAG: phospho-N-acetylmuramoyl-pentapeptide-transferase [Phycisphaerae bacterium]|nr:phospho-N-acetylmuramoyl-pentapeptide-transferase [Phycisphaerae bacterium]